MFWQVLFPSTDPTIWVKISNGQVFSYTPSVMLWLFVFLGLLFSITVHEFAHAWSAHKLGDDTAKVNDRMNLNPLKHFDVLGFLLITFTYFGYGKPVPVNHGNFQNPVQGLMFVSLAGPVSNILQSVLYAVGFIVLSQFSFPSTTVGEVLATLVYALPFIGMFNISLALFNLLPIYPLDGSKIWGYLHPTINRIIDQFFIPYAPLIIMALIIPFFGNSSLLGILFSPFTSLYRGVLGF